jgi:hypothetical protein
VKEILKMHLVGGSSVAQISNYRDYLDLYHTDTDRDWERLHQENKRTVG